MSDPVPGCSRASSLLTFPSPKKKRQRRGPLSVSEKQVLINIFKYVEESWPKDAYPSKTDIVQKTAEIMGVSSPTVYSVLKEYKTKDCVQPPEPPAVKPSIVEQVDDLDLGAIRRKVHQFFFANELPTISKVLEAVNNDEDLPSFKRDAFYKILKKLGFKYGKRNRKSLLLDRNDIVQWRVRYLHQMDEARKAGKKIYYLDETWANEGHTKDKIWQDTTITTTRHAHAEGLSTGLKNPSGKGKRLILGHIGSSTGFLEGCELIFQASKGDGDYHQEMDANNFERWFTKILDKVEPNSIVVMDNASYHSRKMEKMPTLATKKSDIQQWLREKNVSFLDKEIKVQLLQKVKMVKGNYDKYAVDEAAKEKGVTVIRLPPYHCELNPIELIWAQVKGEVARRNKTFKMAELKKLLPEAIRKITPENWKNCEEHIIKEEIKMRTLDGVLDTLTDKLIIHVSDSSSDNSDSD